MDGNRLEIKINRIPGPISDNEHFVREYIRKRQSTKEFGKVGWYRCVSQLVMLTQIKAVFSFAYHYRQVIVRWSVQ